MRTPLVGLFTALPSSFNNTYWKNIAAVLAVLGGLGWSPPAQAQRAPGDVGIGGQIGNPSGVTLKVYRERFPSYDFLAAWDLDDFFFLNAHLLYEEHLGNSQNVHFFFGPGGFLGVNDRPADREDDAVIGLSGRVGLNVIVERFEIYGQVTPRISVVPDTEGNVGGGVGIRFYF